MTTEQTPSLDGDHEIWLRGPEKAHKVRFLFKVLSMILYKGLVILHLFFFKNRIKTKTNNDFFLLKTLYIRYRVPLISKNH